MGTLVIGLAKSVVEGALSKAQYAIEQDAKLRQRAHGDLVFITLEFEMMRSFLAVANEEDASGSNNNVMKTWVRFVRELAYDVEDCIELVVHLDNRPKWWFRLLPSCLAAPLPLDLAVAELEQLRIRAKDVTNCYSRYSRINDDSASSTKVVMLQQSALTASSSAISAVTAPKALIEACRGSLDLAHLIPSKHDGRQVTAVWGGGDLGTTSIIRKVYDDPQISKDFIVRAWVKVMHPFNPHDFIRCLNAQFFANTCKEHEEAIIGLDVLTRMDATLQDDHLKVFVQQFNMKRYLIVLEDLATMSDWNTIRTFLPDRKNGSWIIISTPQFEVASLCVGHLYQVFKLKQFSTDQSVYAFTEVSQGNVEHEVRPHTVLISKNDAAIAWIKESRIIGRDTEMNKLREYIMGARFSNSKAIAVWGVAGIGKSSLVRNFFCHTIINGGGLDQKFGWVDVVHPFNLWDLSWNLLSDFYSESFQAQATAHLGTIRFKDPIRQCRDLLDQNHCLVIIDNLQCEEEWDLIKASLLSRSSKSVIIVTTAEARVARYCADKEELVLNVKGLQVDAAYDLFHQEMLRKNAFSPLNDYRANDKLSKLILKCGGLPKVLTAIASHLASRTVTLMDTIHSTNDRFMHTLETKPEYNSLRGLFRWLYSYLRSCPDSLKPCIFYMSIFSPDLNIRRRRVVRRWVAEGYSRDSEDKSAEQNGEMFFSNLLDLSILQRPPQSVTTASGDTRLISCRLNGFIREFILSRRMEENIIFELEGCCNVTTQRTGRHLIIRESWDRDKIVFESMNFSRLRSLTVFGKWKQFFVSKSMRLLRVLDLEDASCVEDADLEQMLKLFVRLKFLSLRGCREIHRLPSSLGVLRQLQTLDVRHTSIMKLPGNMFKLQKLQYIRAGTSIKTQESSTQCPSASQHCGRSCQVGVMVPRAVDKLTALHTLGVVNIGAPGGKATLKELKDLTQLRKIGVSGINRRTSEKFSSAISGHVHLESLSVQVDKDSQGCLSGIFLPLKAVQSLKLYGPVEKLPVLEINELSKLTKLDLEMTILTEDDIKLIGGLPKLCTLRVKLHDGKLNFCVMRNELELLSYEKVKVLEIACSSGLDITFGTRTMPRLELLKAHCCNRSSVKLSGLRNLSNLKEVLLQGCHDDELMEELKSQLNEHPKKPVLKLEE